MKEVRIRNEDKRMRWICACRRIDVVDELGFEANAPHGRYDSGHFDPLVSDFKFTFCSLPLEFISFAVRTFCICGNRRRRSSPTFGRLLAASPTAINYQRLFFYLTETQDWQNITRLKRNDKLMEEIPEQAVLITDEDLDITFSANAANGLMV